MFDATARYRRPFNPEVAPVTVSVAVVTPEYGAPLERSLQLPPPLDDTCHLKAGAVPLAATMNIADCPGLTIWFAGCPVIIGGVTTVMVAVLEAAMTALFDTRTQ